MRFSMRLRLCRAVFCTCCLMPTALIGGAAVMIHTPAYQAARTTAWQSRLAARLGLEVHVTEIDWGGRGDLVVRGIELCDPESHDWLARARSAIVRTTEQGPVVSLGQPELNFQRLPRLVDVLHEHLLLRSDCSGGVFQLISSSLILQQDPQPQSLQDVRFVLEVDGDAGEAFVEFRPAGSDEGDQVRMRLVRNRQLDPPATGWELHTGPRGLACQLALSWLPELERLGTECTFQGSIWSERMATGWEADISGVFRQLDLDRLITGHFPHKLSGISELMLGRVTLHRGQIAEAAGQLHSAGGVVSQSLLDAAGRHLALRLHPRSGDAMLLRYGELSLEFSLDENGLAIAGRGEPDGVVLADSQGAMLASDEPVRVSSLALIQFLVPLSELQVPAAKETAALFRVLPLPTVAPSTSQSARRNYAPLRLQK